MAEARTVIDDGQQSGRRRAYGNDEVVKLAEALLEEVQKGELSFLAFAAYKSPDKVCYSHAGGHGGIFSVMTGLDLLKGELDQMMKTRQSKSDGEKGANFHEYNLACYPLNFDFVPWIIESEMIRRRMGAPAPLRIGFSHKEELTESGTRILNCVHRPILQMIGAVEDEKAIGGWRKASLTRNEIVLAAKRGEEIPRLRADIHSIKAMEQWTQGMPPHPVTITLREAEHWPHRNSNMEAWLKFARDLRAKGEFVIFVRDTRKANEPLEDWQTCQPASFNICSRAALYERAKCNFFISNGPGELGVFGTCPYLYFIELKEHPDYYANTDGSWREMQGIGEGEQWPWALPGQRMVWAPDTYEAISAAWEEHGPQLRQAA